MWRLSGMLGAALGCLLLVLLFAAVYVVMYAEVSVASTSTLRSGRTVTAQNDGWNGLGVQDTSDTTTINMAGHTIVVAPSQIIVDGRAISTIDPGAKAVSVTARQNEITFTADAKPVGSFRR